MSMSPPATVVGAVLTCSLSSALSEKSSLLDGCYRKPPRKVIYEHIYWAFLFALDEVVLNETGAGDSLMLFCL